MTPTFDYQLLLVEDSPTDAALIQANLGLGLGSANVSRVERLSSAISALSQNSYSAVLLDLNLPDSMGLETFRRLSVKSNGTPIIVLSGMDDGRTAMEAVAAGAADYVQKNHYDAQTLARSVRFAVERSHHMAVERELLIMRNELDAAQRLQDRLYPGSPPTIKGLEIASGIRSAGMGCGDYFDFIRMNDGRHLFVVGDVSGHGMKSAIVMAETRACLRTLVHMNAKPRDMLSVMNRLICAATSEEMFVTLLMVSFDPESGICEYFNAGHPGWILRADKAEQLETHQIPLGLVSDADFRTSSSFTMIAGDVLIMPTDGIQETPSPTGPEMFGTDRLLQTVQNCRTLPASDIVQNLFQAALVFGESDTPTDDMTLVVVKSL